MTLVGHLHDARLQSELDTYWKDKRFEYSGTNIIYRGYHITLNADEDDGKWIIWKYTHTGNNITRIQGPVVGPWTNRDSLLWE